MRHYTLRPFAAAILAGLSVAAMSAEAADRPSTASEAKPGEQAVRQVGQSLVAAFNRGSAKDAAALFLPEGELTDDAGNVHKGRQAIEAILARFFERFPAVRLRFAM